MSNQISDIMEDKNKLTEYIKRKLSFLNPFNGYLETMKKVEENQKVIDFVRSGKEPSNVAEMEARNYFASDNPNNKTGDSIWYCCRGDNFHCSRVAIYDCKLEYKHQKQKVIIAGKDMGYEYYTLYYGYCKNHKPSPNKSF